MNKICSLEATADNSGESLHPDSREEGIAFSGNFILAGNIFVPSILKIFVVCFTGQRPLVVGLKQVHEK